MYPCQPPYGTSTPELGPVADIMARKPNPRQPTSASAPVLHVEKFPAEVGAHAALIPHLKSRPDAPVLVQGAPVFRIEVEGVEHVGHEVVPEEELQSLKRGQGFDPGGIDVQCGYHHAAVLARGHPGGARHIDERVGVPLFHRRQVARVVLHRTHRARHGGALEGVGDHPVVLRVDEALVDQEAAPGEQRVVLVLELAVDLAEHDDAPLTGGQEPGPVAVRRRIRRLRGIADRARPERVEEPPGLQPDPAAQGPGLLVDRVGAAGGRWAEREFPVEVVAPKVDVQHEVAEEGRPLLHLLGDAGDVVAQEPRSDG